MMGILHRLSVLHKAWAFLVIFGILLVAPQHVSAFSGYGEGTSDRPYRISSCEQLQEIENDLDGYYQIVSNINCQGFAFSSISGADFTGTLDGLNHTIDNLSIEGEYGLFYRVNGATVKNITISSGLITGNAYIGSFSGIAYNSTLENLHSSITITPANLEVSAYIGGIVGIMGKGSTLNNSSYSGTLSGNVYMGGLVGNQGELAEPSADVLSNSFFDGVINGEDQTYVGGITGILFSGTISNVYSSGTINLLGDETFVAGGLIGISYLGDTNNSFSATRITGDISTADGIDGTGGIFGLFYSDGDTWSSTRSNLFYDNYIANDDDSNDIPCVGEVDQGSGDCTAVNLSNSTPDYFKNNAINPPYNSSWNFSNIWTKTSSYPTLEILELFNSPSGIPNNGDANNDGILDSYQANVLSIKDSSGNWSTLVIPSESGCTLGDGVSLDSVNLPQDSGYVYQTKLSGFSAYCPTNGQSILVTIIFDKIYSNSQLRYFDETSNSFMQVNDVVYSQQTIDDITKTTASYTITDGGVYDSNNLADGLIKDPVGLASTQLANTGTSYATWIIIALVLISSGILTTSYLHLPKK